MACRIDMDMTVKYKLACAYVWRGNGSSACVFIHPDPKSSRAPRCLPYDFYLCGAHVVVDAPRLELAAESPPGTRESADARWRGRCLFCLLGRACAEIVDI